VEKLIIADIGIKKNIVDDFVGLLKSLNNIKPEKFSQRSDIEKEIQQLNIEDKVKQLIFKNIRRVEQNQYSWKINIPVLIKNISKISGGICLNTQIDKPVLFLYSGLSHYIIESDFVEIKKSIPQAAFVKFEKASHWLHADCPNEFIAEVNRFLK